MAIPVILDTDIGTDVDDTWALAQLLRSPELDPKLILTASGDQTYRSQITARFLQISGRTDIPIGLGVPGETTAHLRNQEPWIRGFDPLSYAGEMIEDGVGRMIQIIRESNQPVTIIAIAPATNIAEALRRAPDIARRSRLVGMFGSFSRGYSDSDTISAETNVRVDPVSARVMFAAPWLDILLTPLDTCGTAILKGEQFRQIWSNTTDPVLRAVIENHCIFSQRVDWMQFDEFAVQSSVLFDCVAVYLAYSETLVQTQSIRFRVSDDGLTILDDRAGDFIARVALGWRDQPAFLKHLTERLLQQTSHVS